MIIEWQQNHKHAYNILNNNLLNYFYILNILIFSSNMNIIYDKRFISWLVDNYGEVCTEIVQNYVFHKNKYVYNLM